MIFDRGCNHSANSTGTSAIESTTGPGRIIFRLGSRIATWQDVMNLSCADIFISYSGIGWWNGWLPWVRFYHFKGCASSGPSRCLVLGKIVIRW
jgi:hypothetical protein